MSMEELKEDDQMLVKLKEACSDLNNLLQISFNVETSLAEMEDKFYGMQENLSIASTRIAPLQSLSIANKALDTRINRAISPALSLLESFKLSESLQRRLLDLATKLSNEKSSNKRLEKLIKYVDTVESLNEAISSIGKECEPAIQKLQEVVEFLSRTKATDQFRTRRLRETLITLKSLCETEVDAMRFDGLFDDALLNLQDEYESLLNKMRHRNFMEGKVDSDDQDDVTAEMVPRDLASELEVEVLTKISETLAANDCLDICIDIFVKVRYRRAAKALMRLNPKYLKTYSPEEIDEMEWESLETAISLWIQHFELAIKNVFVSEKKLCCQVLGTIMDGVIWPECFVKIADKIMAVFFRFGEGVARSKKEPQKLFKLLDMFESLERLKPEFSEIFAGEAGADIWSRYRELEKLLVHSSTKVFFELGLQIEANQDVLPPQDGSVPKLVRYAINYLKYLLTDAYSATMVRVLKIEQIWKAGILSTTETDENLLKDAMFNIMDAIRRNIESKKLRYKDKVLPHVFVMNTYWYIYMRTRSTELGKLMGDQYMKKTYKIVAEESAYSYQKQAWGSLVRLLDKEDIKRVNKDGLTAMVRGKMEAFTKAFDDITQRHKNFYHIPDSDLREQMREATVKLVVPAYTEFLNNFASSLHVKSYPSPEYIEDSLNHMFEVADHKTSGKSSLGLRQMKDPSDGSKSLSGEQSRRSKDFRRSKSSAIDA
ncbi:PREDICTED: exocyst complex component EXO70A1-like [Nicotiana attenuata]|uniref:Exocyst subunit Exo70 family protein n=1 Tax=Nicotiana attenuata TaxID=49451 RepID=A0A314KMQ2_NICAT|nr:PREDICTED: exocyst complex component EXO70A1-like [Nicotiana attenuata]OIT30069.1 exocyst complex component exo70a1 [Nicotiana attenuata]